MIYSADTHNIKIFTTGAFLRPVKVKDVDGNDICIWAVVEFIKGKKGIFSMRDVLFG